jgi:hypothetical protein
LQGGVFFCTSAQPVVVQYDYQVFSKRSEKGCQGLSGGREAGKLNTAPVSRSIFAAQLSTRIPKLRYVIITP